MPVSINIQVFPPPGSPNKILINFKANIFSTTHSKFSADCTEEIGFINEAKFDRL